ncbi:phosphotransferase [Paenibacillus ginsengarvi]|uniref:phosphotransferase n=1 Tax=Paenibacillus ginsengarvi TaxID=400777 RepID=UPI0013158483|nr:phosphotransferase [Paenibacillus ginsengarvi]
MRTQPEVILNRLKDERIVPPDCELGRQMSGTTEGCVYIVNRGDHPVYILKMDAPEYVRMVSDFLRTYEGPLIPALHFTDPACDYFVYAYLSGTVHDERGRKADWLKTLSEMLLNRYERVSSIKGWGWLDEPRGSWTELLQLSVAQARQTIGDLLPAEDHEMVMRLPAAIYRSRDPEAYLLHGDCGVHNFVFESSRLQGVIDPIPMIGPPHYDFLFAFCSSPDDLTMETLLEGASSLDSSALHQTDRRTRIEEVLVLLYCRIGTCLKHHSLDLPDYIRAWAYWRKLRNEEPI